MDEAERLFTEKQWNELDRIAATYRAEESRTPSGVWSLSKFYAGIGGPSGNPSATDWEQWIVDVQAWMLACPESVTAPIALARAYIGYAYHARGGGWAHTVTPKQWASFKERLQRCGEVLDGAARKKDTCPEYWAVRIQHVALSGQGSKMVHRWCEKGAQAHPEYHRIYSNAAHFLLPRWSGAPGEWQRFAGDVRSRNPGDLGDELYARIVWYVSALAYPGLEDFSDLHGIEWEDVRRGFEAMDERFPDSMWNLNRFCMFSVQADDAECARRLFDKIGPRSEMHVWKSQDLFDIWKEWAQGQDRAPKGMQAAVRPHLVK